MTIKGVGRRKGVKYFGVQFRINNELLEKLESIYPRRSEAIRYAVEKMLKRSNSLKSYE